MAFDTFDEGIIPGGMRSKNEIRVLICYLFYSVKENLTKEIVIQSILKEGLANYFEISSAFDDLINNNNLQEVPSDKEEKAYVLSENGKMIASQLDTTLAYTVKEKAYSCATKLLAQKDTERDNTVDIVKTENGFNVVCVVTDGNMELMNVTLYAPSMEQALIMKKNFFESPSTFYKTMLALMTKDKDNVGSALEELYGIL